MNIRKSLLMFTAILMAFYVRYLVFMFYRLTSGFNLTLIRVNFYILGLVIITLLVTLLLPDMKYSYKTKNFLGIALIFGTILTSLFYPFHIKVGVFIGSLLITIVIIMTFIGVVMALKDFQ